MFQQKINNRTKRFLTLVGISLIFVSIIHRIYETQVLSFRYAPIENDVQYRTELAPTDISIPNHNISLGVKPATIVRGTWQISKDGASHLYQSALPGQNGNIVIYAHNKPELFRNLHQVKEGDRVQIRSANGGITTYIVRKRLVVDPDTISVVQPTNHEMLTLYTCTGFADSKRLVLQAYPTS